MECKEIEDHLIDYVEGAIDPATRSRVEDHLARCRTCAERRDELQALCTRLDQDEVPEPDWIRLEQRIRARTRPVRGFRLPYLLPIPVAAVAALFVFILVHRTPREIEVVVPYSPAQIVYSSPDRFQTEVLGELLEDKTKDQLLEISARLDETTELAVLLDALTEQEAQDLSETLRRELVEHNGT
jgi:hypothetical protein